MEVFIQKRFFGPGLKILRYALKIIWLPADAAGEALYTLGLK
jgi:hypothetical protein